MLVDYNVASLMLPMITVGAAVGQMLNKIMPSVVIAIMLTILLLLVSYTTLKKLCRIVAVERLKFGPVCGKAEDEKKVKTIVILVVSTDKVSEAKHVGISFSEASSRNLSQLDCQIEQTPKHCL